MDDQSTQKIIEFVNTHGGLDQSYQVAKKYSEKAFNYLNGYENSLAKSCLEALVDFTVTREK